MNPPIGSSGIGKDRKRHRVPTFFFYAQSPDFHKLGLGYYLKIPYICINVKLKAYEKPYFFISRNVFMPPFLVVDCHNV